MMIQFIFQLTPSPFSKILLKPLDSLLTNESKACFAFLNFWMGEQTGLIKIHTTLIQHCCWSKLSKKFAKASSFCHKRSILEQTTPEGINLVSPFLLNEADFGLHLLMSTDFSCCKSYMKAIEHKIYCRQQSSVKAVRCYSKVCFFFTLILRAQQSLLTPECFKIPSGLCVYFCLLLHLLVHQWISELQLLPTWEFWIFLFLSRASCSVMSCAPGIPHVIELSSEDFWQLTFCPHLFDQTGSIPGMTLLVLVDDFIL